MKLLRVWMLLPLWLATCQGLPAPVETGMPLAGSPAGTETAASRAAPTRAAHAPSDAGAPGWIPHTIRVDGAAVALAELDHDGLPDLVSAGEPELTIWRGDGQGGFTALSRVPGGEQPVDFALVDLNSDGQVDIVAANHDTHYLTILLGDGVGSFLPAPNSPLRIDVQPHPHAVRAADFDQDGLLDLVVDHRDREGLLVLRGLGGGRFERPGQVFGVGGDPYRGMAVGDLNGDGKPDLVTPNPAEIGVLLNASQVELAFKLAGPVEAESPFAVDLGDFNGDGRLDLVAASDEGSDRVALFWGDGLGGFTPAGNAPFRFAPGAKKIAVGDWNGDGLDDAAISSYQSSQIFLIYGGEGQLTTGRLPAGNHPWGLAAADLNQDGRDDLVVGDDTDRAAFIFVNHDAGHNSR